MVMDYFKVWEVIFTHEAKSIYFSSKEAAQKFKGKCEMNGVPAKICFKGNFKIEKNDAFYHEVMQNTREAESMKFDEKEIKHMKIFVKLDKANKQDRFYLDEEDETIARCDDPGDFIMDGMDIETQEIIKFYFSDNVIECFDIDGQEITCFTVSPCFDEAADIIIEFEEEF